MRRLIDFISRDDAATSVEYAVILALILITLFGAVMTFGSQSGGLWTGINGHLSDYGVK